MTSVAFAAEPDTICHTLRDQAATLSDALDAPVGVWMRSDQISWTEVDRIAPKGAGTVATRDLNPRVADRVVASAEVDVSPADADGVRRLTAPLAHRGEGDAVAVAAVTIDADAVARKLVGTALAGHRQADELHQLHQENDAFTMQLAADLEELHFLRQIVDRLSNTAAAAELSGMARETLPILNETVRAQCMAFLITEDTTEPFRARVAHRIGTTTLSDGELSSVVESFGPAAMRGPLVRNWNGDDSHGTSPAEDCPRGLQSLVLTPLTSAGKQFGWLLAADRRPPAALGAESCWQLASAEFGTGEATLMSTSASILAIHAANVEMLREKEQIIVNVVRTLVAAIESKDPYTSGHSERVALYTRRIAEEMGMFEDAVERIYLSGLLHDVGKIGVSDQTLNKPGKLTEAEFDDIAKHPDEGWAILRDLEQLRYVLPGVLHHHERWDGGGYPDGLAGEEIPIEGRIMAVADAFDAMTSDRSYRRGMENERAEAILREGAGVQWDPTCVEAFFACRDDLHRIQREYTQRERRSRERSAEGGRRV